MNRTCTDTVIIEKIVQVKNLLNFSKVLFVKNTKISEKKTPFRSTKRSNNMWSTRM